jgi:hypothetical protein
MYLPAFRRFRPCSCSLPQIHHSTTRSSSFCMCVHRLTLHSALRLSASLPAWLPVGTYSYITLPQGLTRILPPCSFPSVIELASLSTAMPPLGQLGSPSRPTLDPSQTTYLIPAPNHPPCSANSALPDPRTRNTSSPQISHSSASQSRDRNAQKPCQTC